MRPVAVSMSAIATSRLKGASKWIPLDYIQTPENVGLAMTFSTSSGWTASAQFTLDDPAEAHGIISLSQTTTVISVNDTGPDGLGHGLIAHDYVRLIGTQIPSGDAEYDVATIVDENNYTVTSSVSQSAMGAPGALAAPARIFTHSVLQSLTARAVSNFAFGVKAVRLFLNSGATGFVTLRVLEGLSAR